MTTDKIKMIEIGKNLLFNDRYIELDSLWDNYITEHPDDPLGYLSKTSRLMAEMSDLEDDLYREEFRLLTDKVEAMVDNSIDTITGRDRAWYYMLKGHARAYRALYESHFGSMFKAAKLGLSTHEPYEKGLKADSSLYDLYLGIGSYHYWKSAKGGILRFFGILKNEKEKGIRELRVAVDSSTVFSEGARSSLIWIWLEEKRYDSVIAVANEYHLKYPDGKSFLWPLAEAYKAKNDDIKAIEIYEQLRKKIIRSPGNYYNLIEIEYALCELLNMGNNDERLSAVLEHFLSYELMIPKKINNKQSDKIKKMRKLAKEQFND